jgi:uncharacterized membrane protein YfcA
MMDLNLTGLAAALATFLGIWWGHVAVRIIEARLTDIRPAMVIATLLGLGMWTGALLTDWMPLSAALGIFGVTLLWDAYEFYRQEKRVKIGHAPANPDNPRHTRILAEYPSATTLDLLGRDPVGRQVDAEEAARLVAKH